MKTSEEAVMNEPKRFSFKIQAFFKLGVEKFHFLEYKKFLGVDFFIFRALKIASQNR